MERSVFVTAVLYFVHTNGQSAEITHPFTYSAPSTLNFHDIYANSLAMLTGDTASTPLKDDDTFQLGNIPGQFVGTHRQTNQSDLTNTTEVPSKVTVTMNTEQPEELTINVIPITKKRINHQRGVLDLLFPATRVKNFKSVFDTVRRLLSHTF